MGQRKEGRDGMGKRDEKEGIRRGREE